MFNLVDNMFAYIKEHGNNWIHFMVALLFGSLIAIFFNFFEIKNYDIFLGMFIFSLVSFLMNFVVLDSARDDFKQYNSLFIGVILIYLIVFSGYCLCIFICKNFLSTPLKKCTLGLKKIGLSGRNISNCFVVKRVVEDSKELSRTKTIS